MQTRQKLISSAIFAACSITATQTQAALPVDPVLNFTACITAVDSSGTVYCQATGGSYFGMDTNNKGGITKYERTSISSFRGLRISTSSPLHDADATQVASGSHSGGPNGTETRNIDNAWEFFTNTGLHQTTSAVTIISNDNAGNIVLNFSGWNVTWNGIASIPMGSGTWGANANGQAILNCSGDCSVGETYTLDYTATVPLNDPSGFGGVPYSMHLEGTIGGFNLPPVTTNLTTGVLSTTAVPTPGVAGPISLLGNVSDNQDILTNDNDFSSSTPTITNPSSNIATNCTPTSVTANANGTVTFPACPNGTYTFQFTFSDAYETSAPPSTVTVIASGDPIPNAVDDPSPGNDLIANGVTPLVIDVLSNDTDNNLDPASVLIVTNGSHGTATVVNGTTDTISYTANAGYSGTDTFTYTVDDLAAQTSNVATVTVTVNAFNTPASSATFAVGTTAAAAGSTTGIVTMTNIGIPDNGTFPEDDMARTCIGGCFDFILSGVTPGATASVVLPLSAGIPTSINGNTITYRKLINGSWRDFDINVDTFQTAPGTVTGSDVSCPPAGDLAYHGLTTGDRCLVLNITDGGPNDADGLANGTIVDPGGLGEITRISGTDGCSMTGNNSNAADHADWLLLAGFMGLLGWFGMKRRQA